MNLSDWFTEHFAHWIKQRKIQFQEDDLSSAMMDTFQQSWNGLLCLGGQFFNYGTPIWEWEDDWDILVILDGCRHDLFCETISSTDLRLFSNLSTETKRIASIGSCTPEWMEHNFSPEYGDNMAKTAYITGNPHSSADHTAYEHLPLDPDQFAVLDEVWKSEWGNGRVPTIAPRPITDHAIDVWRHRKEHNVEKMIIHYMQPHRPFRSRPDWVKGSVNPSEASIGVVDPDVEDDERIWKGENLWKNYRNGEVEFDEIWKAYKDNLEWVLEDVSLLAENMDCEITISSDHGNAMGEWWSYGHPSGSPVPSIKQVPHKQISGSDKQTYVPDRTYERTTTIETAKRDQRLKDLGYK